jgi:hypothetical protein
MCVGATAYIIAGVLNPFLCAMDTFQFLVKPTDPFSEKFISMHKIWIVRFIEVNKHFWTLEAINYFAACINNLMESSILVTVVTTM